MEREKMVAEAVNRMHRLKMLNNPIREFEKDGILNKSENGGILYWLDDNEKEIVKSIEEKLGGVLIYHVILSRTNLGTMYSFLFVETDEKEWDTTHENMDNEECIAYVFNKEAPDCSELGYIGIKPSLGGVRRTW